MTPEEQVDCSGRLLGEFDGYETGDVISILSVALQMAICYGARSKEDAVHMTRLLANDFESNIPQQYDVVKGFADMIKGSKAWRAKQH